jgi:hypothetical protein
MAHLSPVMCVPVAPDERALAFVFLWCPLGTWQCAPPCLPSHPPTYAALHPTSPVTALMTCAAQLPLHATICSIVLHLEEAQLRVSRLRCTACLLELYLGGWGPGVTRHRHSTQSSKSCVTVLRCASCSNDNKRRPCLGCDCKFVASQACENVQYLGTCGCRLAQ